MRFRRALHLLIGILLLSGCQSIGAPSQSRVALDWSQTLYPLEALSYHPEERGESLWVDDAFTQGNGLLVVASRDRVVRGLDATTGVEIWRFSTRGANVARPVSVGDDVLIASTDGHVYRLRRRSGRLIWTADIPGKGAVLAAPVVTADRAFLTTMENRIVAFDLATGKVAWNRKRSKRGEFTITGHAGILIDGDTLVTGFNDGWLVGYALVDGATLWSTDLGASAKGFVDIDTTPLRVGDTYVVGSHGFGLFALDRVTQDVVWSLRGEGLQTPTLVGDTLYTASATGALIALNATTGKVLWRRKFAASLSVSPAATRRYLCLPTDGGMLLLDRTSGALLERVGDSQGFSARPLFVAGRLYALGNSGRYYALGIY